MGVYWPRDRGAAIERLRGKQDIEDERMKKRLAFFLLALLLVVSAWAAAEEILYTGTVSKTMTIRAKKSTSASKLGSVEPGELLNIIEYGDTWTKVDQNGVVGYVLTKNVEDLAAAAGYNDCLLYTSVIGLQING